MTPTSSIVHGYRLEVEGGYLFVDWIGSDPAKVSIHIDAFGQEATARFDASAVESLVSAQLEARDEGERHRKERDERYPS